MYSLKNKKDNVKEFLIIGTNLTYIKDNKFYVGTKEYNIEPMVYKSDITNNNIWIKDLLWENYVLNISENHLEKLDFNIGLNGIISSVITIFKDNKSQCYSTEKFNFIMDFPKDIEDKTYLSIGERFLIFDKYNHIHAYNIPESIPQWQFKVEQLGSYLPLYEPEQKPFEVAKFLGVWQNQLLVACKGGLIISLNIQDGSLQQKWQQLPKNTDPNMVKAFKGVLHQSGLAYQLNKVQNKIIALYYRHLIEIDLPSGILKVTDLTPELQKHDISIFQHKTGYAEDDLYYYTTVALDENKLGTSYIPTALCALNKKTLAIDWLYRFDQDGTGDYVSVQVPQVSGNKLYQLTQNNVLYIFDKEENTV